ncbi:hypothetical protein TrVGV298_002261 [Trichoderma virens]|nr:hypothetical protein TrVGV298_002261 [Trichoderma virens]
MAYYDAIRDPLTFIRKVRVKTNFATLSLDSAWSSNTSHWGREHLFASRVLCSAQAPRLQLFQALQLFPENPTSENHRLSLLVKGPGNLADLRHYSEAQFVREFQPDSLGYVWAALNHFVNHRNTSTVATAATTDRSDDWEMATAVPTTPNRQPGKSEFHGSLAQPQQAQLGSSSRDTFKRQSNSLSEYKFGYFEEVDFPPPSGCHCASCKLFYSKRFAYTVFHAEKKYTHAVDDGGLHLFNQYGMSVQVAMLESKQVFKNLVSGVPIVSDELLAQMVGQVLALRLDKTQLRISDTDFITILATAHHIKFFHFEISNEYLANYENMSTFDPRNSCFLRVHSTVWLDVKIASHREHIVAHLLALIAWADVQRRL